jgi:hypothetical protein
VSYYTDDWQRLPLPSATVWEDPKTTRVTYRDEAGAKFRVVVRQIPNHIGFHASLPGDAKRKATKP